MKNWHYADPQKQQHQTTDDQLPSLIRHGVIQPSTMVWTPGLPNWLPAEQAMPKLFQDRSQAVPPPVPGAPPASRGRCHEVDYEIFGDDMQIVEVELDPNETVIGEAGAMNYMEEDILFESKMGDGTQPGEGLMGKLLGAGKRMLTGESIPITKVKRRFVGQS